MRLFFLLNFALIIFFLSSFVNIGNTLNKNNNQKKIKRIDCRQTYRLLKKKGRLRNKIIFCDGWFTSSMLIKKNYNSVPKSFHYWLKKYRKKYVFMITHQAGHPKIIKYPMHFYLLSNDEELKIILSDSQKLDFSGQIIQRPIFLKKSWHLLVLREETAIKIE